MNSLEKILEYVELHDSMLESIVIKEAERLVSLYIDFDEVWNTDIDNNVCGIAFKSVYEIPNYKFDGFGVISEIHIQTIDYNKTNILHCKEKDKKAIKIAIEFVCGGFLEIIYSGQTKLRNH